MNENGKDTETKRGLKTHMRKYVMWTALLAGFVILCVFLPWAALMD